MVLARHDRRPQFLAELTQMSADIDELLPQFAQFVEHYKGLVSCIQSSLAKVGDVGQDLVGGLGPDKRL